MISPLETQRFPVSRARTEVNVHLTATGAVLTYTANAGYRFGDGQFVDANFGAGFTGFASCTEYNGGGTGFALGTCSNGGSQVVDGFGTFNQTTDNTDGFKDSAIQVVLTVNGTWATENDVLAKNADGWFLAAHIFVCDLVDASGVCSPAALSTPATQRTVAARARKCPNHSP